MAIVYLVDRGNPENADFFAGRSNGFRVWMERSSVEWAERTAREFSEVDLYLVERYKDGWVLRSLRSATPFEGHARRIARQDARMPEAIRNVLSPMSPYRPIVHGRSKKGGTITYGGHDIAKMHDELHHRHKALIKGIHVEVKQTPGRRGGKYDKFELLINNKKVWDGEAASIDPLNIAGGTIEAFVLHALDQAGIKREKH